MKKNILIPTDFSENSWNAIVYALSFFKKVNCNVYILHVSSNEEITGAGVSLYDPKLMVITPVTHNQREQMSSFLKRIERLTLNTKHHFFPIYESLFFVDAVRKQVKEKSIDYIVMGTKGASGLKEKMVGSNTGDVITKVKCPVLVVPEKASYTLPKEIAFPTDYNLYYKRKILNTINEVITLTNASLRILHVSKKERDLTELQIKNKEFLDDELDNLEHSFHFLSNPDLEAAVQCFVESRDIDMITMVAKNLNFFQRILFHPTVEKISYHISIPFLVLHE
ncbi:universal stress protein [Aquimarina sp. 2201CG5-10]|uniref:universal stress protein n=1 Tax=Aquimarina callyspongiae TaxID=3098150 RepID=UPI002AB3AF51|nr:universal stress protein [Aquimarina sp. 2201CG5-10]MDY8134938.1 universal stress protein [Aquimarina sp. 2201CG5-10]